MNKKYMSVVSFLLIVLTVLFSANSVSSEAVGGSGIYDWKCEITLDLDNTYDILAGDINNDGLNDIVVGNGLNGGTGSLLNKVYLQNSFNGITSCIDWNTCPINPVGFTNTYDTRSISLEDMNADGWLDVIVGNANGPTQIYVNGGVGTDGCIVWYGSNISTDSPDTRQVLTYADMNRDGLLDVVAAVYGAPNRIYINGGYNAGTHSFTWTSYPVTTDAFNTLSIAIADINEDGWPDIVSGENLQDNYIYYNTGSTLGSWSNTWSKCLYVQYPTDNKGVYWPFSTIKVLIKDMGTSPTNSTLDGNLDIILAEEPPSGAPGDAKQHRFSIYYNNNLNCSWTLDKPLNSLYHAPSDLIIDDIDGDGDDRDLLVGHDSHKNAYFLYPGYFKVDLDPAQYRTVSMFLADLDDDGCLELIIGNLINTGGGAVEDGQNVYYSLSSTICNGRPKAYPDAYTVCSGSCLNAYVLLNDMDPENDPLTITDANVTDPTKGYTVNYGTYIRYCANSGQSGTDTFTYRVSDGSKSDTAIVTITISPSPIAVPDSATTCGTTPVSINVLTNDLNKTGATATLLGTPVNGGVTEPTEGNFVFTPTTNGVSGYFDYNLSNGICWSQARVTITSNIKPDAVADSASTCGLTCVNVSVLDNDKNASGVTLSLIGTPVNGTPTIISGNRIKFCPSIPSGTGSFDYNITNGTCYDVATVTVTIYPQPDAQNESASTCSTDCVNVSVLDNDTYDSGDYTLSVVSNSNGTATVKGTNVEFCPSITSGTGSFVYNVSNGDCWDTATVTINFNNPPVAVDDSAETCGTSAVVVGVLGNDANYGSAIPEIISGSNVNGSVTYLGGGNFQFIPTVNVGTGQFDYNLSNGGCSDTARVYVTIKIKPDAVPESNIDVCNTNCANISVLDNDKNYSNPTITIYANASHGTTEVLADNTIKYCPTSGYVGADSFDYNLSSGGCYDIATVTVNVISCGLVAVDDEYETALNTCKDLNVTLNDYDPEYPSDPTKFWIIDANVTDPLYGNASWIDGYTIRYCPDANWCGTDTFKYRILDVNGSTADANVTITVPCPPIDAVDDYNKTKDRFTCVDFNITDNDDGYGYHVQIVPGSITTPSFGNVTVLDPNGTIRFCPQGTCGTVTFDYNATNGFSMDRATVTVDVPCPQATCPIAVDDYNKTEMNTCVILSIMSNDYDPNGDPIKVVYPSITDPKNGVIEFIDYENGIIKYCPDESFCGTDIFEYTIVDIPRSPQDKPCEKTATVRIDVMCPKEKVPAILLYPLVDIERLTISKEPVVLDENIDSLLNTGVNVVLDGKVISVFEIVPGTQSLIAQVENRGFVTQAGVMIRFEGLPNGVTYKLEPPSQKIKAHNIGTYAVTITAPADVPEGIYHVKAIAYTRSGTLDEVELRVVIS